MVDSKLIPNEHHIARYCGFRQRNGDRVEAEAFLLKEKNGVLETGVSVNWLEYFSGNRENQIDQIRRDLHNLPDFTLGKQGCFAVLGVGAVRQVHYALDVVHRPENGNLSHTEIHGLSEPLWTKISVKFERMVKQADIFPAFKGP